MKQFSFIVLFILGCSNFILAQKTVGLDNWFNREINAKTNKPYHYLWTDTAWSGYSRWGSVFNQKGAKTVHIEKPSSKNLKPLSVYIIVDPDTTTETPNPNYILAEDVKVIKKWVKRGGVLVLLGNDAGNCEFTHLNQLASVFGIVFNFDSYHKVPKGKWDNGAFTSFSNHPMFLDLHKIYLKEISSFTLKKPAQPILTENGITFMAESLYGKGKVIAIGDPWIYNEYIDHDRLPADFENRKAAENFTNYLLKISK
jgi:unsaturated rhamnogalacturonyl hydrolase